MTAREEILGRIRAAGVPAPDRRAAPLSDSPSDGGAALASLGGDGGLATQRGGDSVSAQVDGAAVSTSGDAAENPELLTEMLSDYSVGVVRSTGTELRRTIGKVLASRGVNTLLVPDGFPPEHVGPGHEIVPDDGTVASLSRADGVATTCALAVAQTGTIVLDGGPGQGSRAATLIPDYHLCVVRVEQIVRSVPEGVSRLKEAIVAGRPITFISGPSATSDIELTRVEGVHGPRTLDVVIVE